MGKRADSGHTQSKLLVCESARSALERNAPHEFNEAWEQYRLLCKGDLPSSKPEVCFWCQVLGPQWHGHAAVPRGAARDKLVQLLGLRYALTPYTGDAPLPVAEMPKMLQFAVLLAAGDRRAIEQIRPGDDAEEATARAACLQMLDGEWEMAAASFADCFRPRSVLLYRVLHTSAAPLLAFALLCAVRSGSGNALAEHWVDVLQRLLPEPFPETEGDALTAFVHNIQVAGDILNNGRLPRYIPDTASTAACLPLALCYRGFSAVLRSKIKGKLLAGAARDALLHGPALLGYYAATALLGTDVALPPESMSLLQKLRQNRVVPMYADIPPLDPTDPLRPQTIRETMAQESTSEDETLGWDLVFNRETGTVQELRPIIHSTRQNAWLTRDLEKCSGIIRVQQDLAGLSMVGGIGGADIPLDWIAAMAGHPRLRMVIAGKKTADITLLAEKPRIHIRREQDFIALVPENLDYRKLRGIAPNVWGALQHSPALEKLRRFINAYGVDGQLRFNPQDTGELYTLLGEWEKDFDFIGTLSDRNETVEEDCRLLASVAVSPKGVEFRLGIQVLPGSEKIFPPATGPQEVDVQTPAGIFHVRRAFDKEQECLDKIGAFLPDSLRGDRLPLYWEDVPQALEHMARLEAAGVILQRKDGTRMHCYTPSVPYVELKTRSIGSEWFDIGGELQVDEELTLQLRELLAALSQRIGSFIPVRNGYMRMPESMDKQLTTLHSLMSVKGRMPGLSIAALLAMAQALGEQNLPPVLRERLQTAAHTAGLEPPPDLKAQLRPYQLQGYRWLAERAALGIGCCLADDMGLGKTLQLTALLLHLAPKGPSLVVAPLSLQRNWERELARFAPSLRVLPFSPNRPWHIPEPGEVVLASYGQLTNNIRHFSTVPWNVLALDEAQAVKNPDSRRSKAVCSLPGFARVCLTGTPVENSEMDLWSLMRFLNPLLFGTKASFRRRFLEKSAGSCPLRDIVASLFLRRTKAEVLTELPELVEQVLPVELADEERAVYEAIRRRTLEQLEGENNHISVLAELMRLRRACCHGKLVIDGYAGGSSKLEMLLHVLEELKSTGHKVLVFSQFTDVLDLAEPLLNKGEFRIARLDGSHTPKQREEAIRRFRQGEADVFLISLKAGGTGLNLTEADYVILLDPWWNPAVEAQAASRSHRMGQQHPVTLYRLIATHTVEEKILRLHENKKELADTLLSGATLPIDEIRLLLAE